MGTEIKKCLVETVTDTVFNFLAVRDLIDVNELDNVKDELLKEIKEYYPDRKEEDIRQAIEDVIYDIRNSMASVCYYDELPLVIVQMILNKLS